MPSLPLDLRGTAFQRAVWAALRDIPPGCTETYGEVAARIGRPGAARAVARACAANPVALLVPCHRVVPKARGTVVPKARGTVVPKARGTVVPKARGTVVPKARGTVVPTARGCGVPKARRSRALPDSSDTGGWRWGAARKRELLAREAAR